MNLAIRQFEQNLIKEINSQQMLPVEVKLLVIKDIEHQLLMESNKTIQSELNEVNDVQEDSMG